MTNRPDIFFNIDAVIDANGEYWGEWLDTSGVDKLRIAYAYEFIANHPRVYLQESMDGVNKLEERDIPEYEEMGLVANYARVVADDGDPGAKFLVFGRIVRP